MRRDVYTVDPEDHVTRAMALMTQHRVRHLPVVSSGKVVGIVSIGDAVKNRLDDLEAETRVLRDIYIAAR
jgi:CBS domain-containing protein